MAADNAPARSVPGVAGYTPDEQFRTLFENAGVGMVLIDGDCNIFEVNRAFCEIVGRDSAELIGTTCMDITHADDKPENERVIAQLSKPSEKSAAFEKRYIRPDGQPIWVRINLSKIALGDEQRVLAVVEDVSDRKVAEAALQQSEERFRNLISVSNQVLYRHNADWSEMRQLSGGGFLADTAEPDPDWFDKYIHPDDQQHVWERIQQAISTRTPFEYEHRVIREDGTLGWTYSRSIPILDEDGEIIEWFGAASDTTERNQIEEALRNRSEEFYALADNIPALAWMAYADGHIFWYNRRWYEYTGTTPDSQEGWGWESVHDPDQLPLVKERWLHSITTGEPFEMIFPLKGADGIFRPFLTRIIPIRSEEGEIDRWFGTNVDISEQVRAERELREESNNLEILNRTGAAIASELDLKRVVQLVTDAGVELTGAQFGAFFYNLVNEAGESYTLYTLSGVDRSAFDKFPMPRNTQVFAPTFRGEGVVRSDDITRDPRYGKNPPYYGKPKGHLPVVSYLAVPVISRTGEVLGGLFFGHPEAGRFKDRHERLMTGIAAQAAIAIDNATLYRAAQHEIEQRVKAEQALTALNETLESRVVQEIERRSRVEEVLRQAQKMETVGQLSGGIAHDFNNLLQVIHGNLSLLEHAVPQSEDKLRRAIANALSGTERAAALTKRLLAFSRRQPLDQRAVDVNRLIEEMTELLHRTIGETIVIETRLSSEVPNALVDPNQLENAILNLAINARDAMPRGGRLEIATAVRELEGDDGCGDGEPRSGSYVCISVGDNGEGMSAEVLERAVEPFFSTKEVGQGTGLGLSTVYGFARQSGGTLMLSSAEGVGTTVELCLPCAAAAAPKDEAPRSDAELPQGRGERVLLCEDDEGVRSFSAETLRQLGYEVIEAGDAAAAIEALRASDGFDILFTDVVLPGGRTGADLVSEARALQPGLKILFTTGYARTALDKEQAGGRSLDLLLKPFGVDQLATKIRSVLEQA